jgi:hypothetical protein
MGFLLTESCNLKYFLRAIRGTVYVMILTKRRLIIVSVAIGLFLLLFKVTASFFDDSPKQGPPDFEQALRELLEEADRGSTRAHYRLGRFFEEGIGISRNPVKAHAWYTLAAAEGMLEASMARDALAREMTREELAQAYRLAVEWSTAGEADDARVAGAAPPVLRDTINADAEAALSEADATVVSNHLAAGLNPDSVDSNGDTLLNRAVEGGNIAVIEAVLDAGADANAPGLGGRRPLTIAAAAGRDDMVALLVERGADPTLRDAAGRPALVRSEPANPVSAGTGSSKPETALDDFVTAAGRDPAAAGQGLDTTSRKEISRDLLGATVGDGREVATKSPEDTAEKTSPRGVSAPPERAGANSVPPPALKKIQTARTEPGDPATAPRPLSRPNAEPPRLSNAKTATDNRVKTAQTLLARLGYDPGPADGLLGSKTQAAVGAYQKDKGEPATGKISEDLLAKLNTDVVAQETRRLAEIEQRRETDAVPTRRAENRDAWANLLGGVQKFLGHEFDSTVAPEKIRAYCRKNGDNWIYDFGTDRFVLCRDIVGDNASVSR